MIFYPHLTYCHNTLGVIYTATRFLLKDYEVQVTLVQDEPPTAPKAKKDSLSAAVEAGREGYRVAYTVEKRKRQQ